VIGSRWATELRCPTSGERLPLDEPAGVSAVGKPLLVDYNLSPAVGMDWVTALGERQWSMWRYRELLPMREMARRVSLGEGGTPLVRLRGGRGPQVWVKQEAGNPTGSFKDRGLAMAVSRATELGAPGVELPSAGNAALALSAYAAAAGLPARVAMPEATPKAIQRRCLDYGAEVLMAGNTLVDSAARLAEEPSGFWNLSTLKEPFRVEGKKTMGLEIAEQLNWRLPDWILYPTGGGTGIVGMHKAFAELRQLGLVGPRMPRLVAVQSDGCAPVVRAFEQGLDHAPAWEEPESTIWGLRVPQAIGDFLVLQALRESGGRAIAVPEASARPAAQRLQEREGVVTGPEGGAAMVALEMLIDGGMMSDEDVVVVFQTGHPANYGSPEGG
jgi:threonine synthase